MKGKTKAQRSDERFVTQADDDPVTEVLAFLRKDWLFEVAAMEIDNVLPPPHEGPAQLQVANVRLLMITAWLRGATWQREQARGEHGPTN